VSIQLRAKLEDVNKQLDDVRQRHKEVVFALKYSRKQLDEIQRQDASLATLSRILEDINQLEQQDSIQLLWGESCTNNQAEQKRQRLETSLKDYDTRVSSTQHRITGLLDERARLNREINSLLAQQEILKDKLSRVPDGPHRLPEPAQPVSTQIILPWSNKRNDAIRLRAIMMTAIIVVVLLGYIVPRWEIPEPKRIEFIEIPERLATLIIKKAPPPPPVAEQPTAEEADTPEEEPTLEEKKSEDARNGVGKIGLLAFSQEFAEIRNVLSDIQMGAQAKIITTAPAQRRRPSGRSMITSPLTLPGRSKTFVTSAHRIDAIGDDNKLKKVEFSRIENTVVTAMDSKQLNRRTTAAKRSDEEIQVVFDRYKEALYRIYNRELRKNSFLEGKLVLQLTIEPSGKVSKVKIDYNELNSPELEKKILARVMRFNFGEKKGASPLTILYPINFLPAS